MSDSMTVQLRVVKGSSSQFRIELSPSHPSSSYVMTPTILEGAEPERVRSAVERFWSKVDIQPGDLCWKWMGEVNHRGYGRTRFADTSTVAHRFAYELMNGPVPDGLQCGHLCHNTRCVRPDHLEAMTCAKNIAQRDERLGRTPGQPMSSTERSRQGRIRAQAKREQDRRESGWWVEI